MSVTTVLTIALTVITVALPGAVLVHAIRRTRREPRRLSNAFWLLSGAFFLIISWLYARHVRSRPARQVLLGSGLVGGDRVPPLLAGRIAAGLTANAERGAGLMIMSGGQGPDEKGGRGGGDGRVRARRAPMPSGCWSSAMLREYVALLVERWPLHAIVGC